MDNLKIVMSIQALVERAADELKVPTEQLLTHMVLDCLGNQDDVPELLRITDRVVGAIPTSSDQVSF